MEKSKEIYQKLEAFIRKYYTNELIRGIIFFMGLGLLYFIFTVFVEYFFWLKPQRRSILFGIFLFVEIFLFFRFILFPLFKLFKLQKGIDYNQASLIIGSHFSEVNDKLTNYLQLSNAIIYSNGSELLLASIAQKANTLHPIPFGKAIDFKKNKRFLPLALIPIFFLFFFYISGNSIIISQSLDRVVHFNTTFTPAAPFKFVVLDNKLITEQGKDFVLHVKTEGSVIPENVMIFIDNESYFLETIRPGEFQFKIAKPSRSTSFYLEANEVVSSNYELKVLAVPSITNFEMKLTYPSYLNLKNAIIKGTGNAIIPEGTQVTWVMNTNYTQDVVWKDDLRPTPFVRNDAGIFNLSKVIFQNTDYQIVTSNSKIKNFEKLEYQLNVVKDQFPSITVSQAPDSLKVASTYFVGQLSDDYGLSKLQIVYYESGKPQTAQRGTIAVKNATFDQFVFDFPSNLNLKEGATYDFYFEVFDNDILHHFKSARSSVFSNHILSEGEKQSQLLQEQNSNINGFQRTLSQQSKQLTEMERLQNIAKEKTALDFKDHQRLNDFVKQQNQQNELMKEFANKLKNNLEQSTPEVKDETKNLLQKRLENAEKELEANKKLLDELNKLNDKIEDEKFVEKLEKFKEKSKNDVKNLAQLVELTKRYYVEKKAEQLADELNKLSQKEDKLSESEKENATQEQENIKEEFKDIQEELNKLNKENDALKSPMDIPGDADKEKSIENDLNKASVELQKKDKSKAKQSQKSASKKMKEMSKAMEDALEQSGMEQMEEDVKMLRQILDNLLAFSFSQENMMDQFKKTKPGSPSYNANIKGQQNLKLQFKHIDDSLFALSLRNPKLAESVTKEVANVQYNVDKSLESLSDLQFQKGFSQQQYAISSANKLADLLSDILNTMQMDLSGMSGGKPKPNKGKGMQLPDIMKKQAQLGEKMKKGMKENGKPKDGKPSKGEGNGSDENADGEGDAKATMEIYKEQKQLRESLQEELNKQGLGNNGQNAVEQMKQLEKQLLNKGLTNQSLQKTNTIEQELLKLNTAIRLQGEDPKRESETNTKNFKNQANSLPPALSEYLNSIEILNRQSLPLRSNFNKMVQEYFNQK